MVKDILINKFQSSGNKVAVIPHCSTKNFFDPQIGSAEFRCASKMWLVQRFRIPPSAPIVVSLSGLAEKKGIEYLIRAIPLVLREIPETFFVIGGAQTDKKGSYVTSLKMLSAQMGINSNLLFAGRVPFKEVPSFLGASDVVVVSSIIDEFNRVAVETNAVGSPVVITEGCGVVSWIQRFESGIIVPVADHHALAKEIINLLKNPSMARRLGENGISLKREFHPLSLARESLKHYEAILCGH